VLALFTKTVSGYYRVPPAGSLLGFSPSSLPTPPPPKALNVRYRWWPARSLSTANRCCIPIASGILILLPNLPSTILNGLSIERVHVEEHRGSLPLTKLEDKHLPELFYSSEETVSCPITQERMHDFDNETEGETKNGIAPWKN